MGCRQQQSTPTTSKTSSAHVTSTPASLVISEHSSHLRPSTPRFGSSIASSLADDSQQRPSFPTLLSRQPACAKESTKYLMNHSLSVKLPADRNHDASGQTCDANKCKRLATWCLEQVADGKGVDIGGLVQLRKPVSQALGIPEASFGSMQRQHLRFNVNGSGRLSERELYLLFTMNLREHHKRAGPNPVVPVPNTTLSAAGYSIVQEAGKGNQSIAFLANDRVGKRWCVKAFEKGRIGLADLDNIMQEYDVLKSIAPHPNIPNVADLFQDGGFYYMVQSFYEGGDFTTLRQRSNSVRRTELWWRDVFRQCFEGIAHLHGNALIHCDIKESNLMIREPRYESPKVVIIDFGLMQTAASDRTLVAGTPGYIPPEVWEAGKWYPSGDVFSMGVVVMQMLLDRIPPHHNPPECEVLPGGIFTEGATTLNEASTVAKTREPPTDALPPEFQPVATLARKMLEKDVQKRLQAKQVLRDAWFI